MTRPFQKSRLPDDLKAIMNMFPGGTAFPISTGEIVCSAEAHRLAQARQPGVVVSWTPILHLQDQAAVFRFTSEFLTPDRRVKILQWDYYLNADNPYDIQALRKFGVQDKLIHHLYDLGLNYMYSKQINVYAATRRDMQNMMQQAIVHNQEVKSAGAYDYVEALAKVQEQYGYK